MSEEISYGSELAEKRRRVLELLEKQGLDGLVLTTLPNVSWFTGGADLHVARNTSEAVGTLLIAKERLLVLASASETQRLRAEEFASGPFEVLERPWYESAAEQLKKVTGSLRLGSDDRSIAETKFFGPEIAGLRYMLTLDEVERYRETGKLAGRAIEAVARAVVPGMTEWQVAALLDKALLERGLEPTVTLIAADERISRFRHPIPTMNRVERCCMLVTCARRKGLIAAATRIVHFGPVPDDLRRRHLAVADVDATAIALSQPGVTMGELYSRIVSTYTANGYPGEERFHHQGGAIGYENREYLATPGSPAVIHVPQALAWNPSIAGTKSEDTYLIIDGEMAGESRGAGRAECLTTGDGSWPVIEVSKAGLTLQRPDILTL